MPLPYSTGISYLCNCYNTFKRHNYGLCSIQEPHTRRNHRRSPRVHPSTTLPLTRRGRRMAVTLLKPVTNCCSELASWMTIPSGLRELISSTSSTRAAAPHPTTRNRRPPSSASLRSSSPPTLTSCSTFCTPTLHTYRPQPRQPSQGAAGHWRL